MAKQLSPKAKKGIIIAVSVVVILALIIAIPNICFAVIGSQEQKGVATGYDWSADASYSEQKTEVVDMGDGDFKIMVITDIHLKNSGTFAKELGINYLLDGVSKIAVDNMVKKENPDMILVLGDMVLTKRNDIELERFVKQMDSYKKPWACVFGNHDDEGRADKNKLVDVLGESEYGMFTYGPDDLHGAGNYVIELKRGDTTEYALFMMDSGSSKEFADATDGINAKQVEWYKWNMEAFKEKNGSYPKNMAFFHIPLPEYEEIVKGEFIMGESAEKPCIGHTDGGLMNAMLAMNGTHILAGHDHNNNFIAEYKGMKVGYATKSTYNCYFKSGMTGSTILTIDKNNNVTERIVKL